MRKATPKTSAPAATQDWRAQVADLIASAKDAMNETAERLGLDVGNGPFAWQLLSDAQELLDKGAEKLRTGSADDYYGDVVLPVQSMVLGARDMKDAHRALPAMLETAFADLARAEEILDKAGPEGPRANESAQPLADAPIAAPGADTQAGRAVASEQIETVSGYPDFTSHLSYKLFNAMYQALGARALLRENERVDEDENLTGISYLLTGIAEACEALAADLDESTYKYTAVAKEASHG